MASIRIRNLDDDVKTRLRIGGHAGRTQSREHGDGDGAGSSRHNERMGKFVGIILWWQFLMGATVLLENLIGAFPRWAQVVVVVALGAAAVPLMFWKNIKSWLTNPSTIDGTANFNASAPPQGP